MSADERSGPQVFCELYVTDVAQSLIIFRDALGLTVVRDEGGFAVLNLGPTELLLNAADPGDLDQGNPLRDAPPGAPRGVGLELGIVVDDLAAALVRVSALDSVVVTSALESRPWGAQDFRFLHPDGFYVRVSDA